MLMSDEHAYSEKNLNAYTSHITEVDLKQYLNLIKNFI